MKITLNGEPYELTSDATMQSLVESLQLDVRKIAIEQNQHIIQQGTYATTALNDGDTIEIINFIGGG